jgi:hypothetical protein
MKPIALAAIAALAACGPQAKPVQPGEGSAMTLHAKKIQLAWGITQGPHSADVFLQTTDETGAQVSHALGTFDGQCATVTPDPDMGALIAVLCASGATGLQLQALASNGQVIVMRLHTQQGVKPDPMSRDELTRFPAPPGAAIEAR